MMKRIYFTSMVMAFMLAIANVMSVSAEFYTENVGGVYTTDTDTEIEDESRAMTISYISIPKDDLVIAEDGTVTLEFKYVVTNTGNVTLEPGDEDYSVALYRLSDKADMGVFPIEVTLAPNEESDTLVASATFTPAYVDDDDRYDVRENVTQTYTTTLSWIYAVPNIAKMAISYNGSELEEDDMIDLGIFYTSKSVSITLENYGVAPLVITSVNLPTGYSIAAIEEALPYTIEAGDEVTVDLVLEGIVGSAAGTISFDYEGAGLNSFAIGGVLLDDTIYYEDFESGEVPAGWILDDNSNWKMKTFLWNEPYSGYCLQSSISNSIDDAITPKFAFDENGAVSFYASRGAYNSSCTLTISYSEDRATWTEVATITCDNEDSSLEFEYTYSTILFKFFSIPIPEGEYYIKLSAGYVYVDDFVAGTVVDVDYDLLPSALTVSGDKTVNHPLTATFDVKNLTAGNVSADDYTVTLYADGEEVATDFAVVISGGETVSFEMSYTPHAAGDVELYATFAIGDEYVLNTAVETVTIGKEVLEALTQVGEITNGIYSEYYIPLNTYYYNSISETVYPAEFIELEAGTAITSVAYPYFKDTDTQTTTVTIWMENTTEETPTELSDTTAIAKVYADSYEWVKSSTVSSSEFATATFALAEPFVYTGGNIRVIITSSASSYKKMFFGMDENNPVNVLYKYNDTFSTYVSNAVNTMTDEMPVIYFGSALTPKAIAGTITDADGDAVAGATVTATCGDVMYATITDEAGAYSLDVVQSDLEYTLTVSADGYLTYIHAESVIMTEDVTPVDAVLEEDTTTAIKPATVATTEVMAAGNGSIIISATTAQKVAIYTVDGRMVANVMVTPGKTTLQGLAKGIYIVNNKKVAVR